MSADRKRGRTSAPRRSLLTGDYDALTLAERCESLGEARIAAQQQAADEDDQDRRLGVRIVRDARRIPDARIAAMPADDPRRLAYVRALREERDVEGPRQSPRAEDGQRMSDATLSTARRAALADPAERAAYLARYARLHSPADVLRERVRVRDLRANRLKLAARLAHPVALEVHPRVRLIDWTSWSERRKALRPLVESDRLLVVSWLTDGAERALGHAEGVLPVYEARCPGDSRPHRAIEAGRDLCVVLRRCVRGEATDGDVREARRAADAAAADAYAAADAAYSAAAAVYAADDAAYAADAAAACTAYAACAADAADAADAAAYAYAAAYAADADAYAAACAADAADAADERERRRREARDAEHAWRRDRLALYLLVRS